MARPIGAGELGRRLIFRSLGVAWAKKNYSPRAIVVGPNANQKRTVVGEAVENLATAFAIRTLTNPFPLVGTYRIWLELRDSSNRVMLKSTKPIVLSVDN